MQPHTKLSIIVNELNIICTTNFSYNQLTSENNSDIYCTMKLCLFSNLIPAAQLSQRRQPW
jgi:hypothetical protein